MYFLVAVFSVLSFDAQLSNRLPDFDLHIMISLFCCDVLNCYMLVLENCHLYVCSYGNECSLMASEQSAAIKKIPLGHVLSYISESLDLTVNGACCCIMPEQDEGDRNGCCFAGSVR
jgi:hypothetical protein